VGGQPVSAFLILKFWKDLNCSIDILPHVFLGHLKFLIAPYDGNMCYFEAIDCVRRLCLACAIGLFDANSAVSATTGLLVCILFIWVFSYFKPYKSDTDDSLSIILQFSLTLLFLAALMIKVDVSSDYSSDSQAFGNILLVVLAAGPIGIAYNLLSEPVFAVIGTVMQLSMLHDMFTGQGVKATGDELEVSRLPEGTTNDQSDDSVLCQPPKVPSSSQPPGTSF
jgi:hypothetical protein